MHSSNVSWRDPNSNSKHSATLLIHSLLPAYVYTHTLYTYTHVHTADVISVDSNETLVVSPHDQDDITLIKFVNRYTHTHTHVYIHSHAQCFVHMYT